MENQTLKQLVALSIQIEGAIIENEGQLTPEVEAELKLNEMSMAQKIDGYAMVLGRLNSAIEYHNAKMKEHAALVGKLENSIDWIEGNLKQALIQMDRDVLSGAEYCVKLKNNPPKVDVMDETQVPEEFFDEKVTKLVSKTRIKESLQSGVDVPGARLLQTSRVTIGLKRNALEN